MDGEIKKRKQKKRKKAILKPSVYAKRSVRTHDFPAKISPPEELTSPTNSVQNPPLSQGVPDGRKQRDPNPYDKQTWLELAAWQLRHLGYTIEQTAQILQLGTTTVKDYERKVSGYYAELPAVEVAIDALKTMIPKAVGVIWDAMNSQDLRLAKETATELLKSQRIITDRREIDLNDKRVPTDELISEIERIIDGRTAEVNGDNLGSEAPETGRTLSIPDSD
jgi:hypothetical protein